MGRMELAAQDAAFCGVRGASRLGRGGLRRRAAQRALEAAHTCGVGGVGLGARRILSHGKGAFRTLVPGCDPGRGSGFGRVGRRVHR